MLSFKTTNTNINIDLKRNRKPKGHKNKKNKSETVHVTVLIEVSCNLTIPVTDKIFSNITATRATNLAQCSWQPQLVKTC